MKLISWNVNGLRALERKEKDKWLWNTNADVVTLQEIKAEKSQLSPALINPEGYYSYFNSSTERKGYSGVALYAREEADEIIFGLNKEPDSQGRVITYIKNNLAVIGAYFPNGGGKIAPLAYKLDFFDSFLTWILYLRNNNLDIIFGGDINVAHTAIDLARPVANKNNIGFLPKERKKIDAFIDQGFIDTFRSLNPTKEHVYTYWDMKSGARDRNVGWRIDYWFTTMSLTNSIMSFKTHTDIYGSDHCPIELNMSF